WQREVNQLFADRSRWKPLHRDSKSAVYQNLKCQARAWMVDDVEWISPEAIRQSPMRSLVPERPGKKAIAESEEVPAGQVIQGQFETKGSIKITSRWNDSITCEMSANGKSFMVLSEAYHPSWKAFIDEEPVSVYRVNGFIMGIAVPEGEHVVEFRHESLLVLWGMAVSLLSVLGAILLVRVRGDSQSCTDSEESL
ncbi:MAG: YfhO family protein, partial [Planctomycetota bacterium]|nr:YfhO family protein [Planctomycetota bacterium]